jgi:hypothetical protein
MWPKFRRSCALRTKPWPNFFAPTDISGGRASAIGWPKKDPGFPLRELPDGDIAQRTRRSVIETSETLRPIAGK